MQNSQGRVKLFLANLDTSSPLAGYGTALLAVALASLLRLGMNTVWEQRFPYIVFFPAVVAAGVIGGLWPGVLSIALSALAVSFFVYPPLFTFQLGPNNDPAGLIAFALTSVLLAVISAAQRQARQESQVSAAQAIAARDDLKVSEERFVTTLRSIGDGVLATDDQSRVTFLNNVAAQLTGWTERDAVGKDVHEVFDIIHETTRQPVSNPIDRVLKEGILVGLANHTILRSRDGKEYGIDDSGAPIRDSEGQLVGAVLVFRDISEQRQIQKVQEALARRNAVENRIGEALRSGMSPNAIQAVATAALGEALEADRCYLSLNNLSSSRVIIRDDWRRTPDLPSVAGSYPLEDFIEDASLLYPRDAPLATVDFEAATNLTSKVREHCHNTGVRSAITLGLYSHDTLIAAINVAMADQPRHWTEEEIALVKSVATVTLTVVESARLREQEHNVAVRLQEVLRPTLPNEVLPELDVYSIYQAALDESSLGGDFFDVFPISPTRHAFVVADLAGKGLKAASQVAMIRYLLRALLYTYGTKKGGVADAITQLNKILTEQDLITGFATLFVGAYDLTDHSLNYVCCGQEPALHYVRKDDTTLQLEANGPILGAFIDGTFEENQTILTPGDAVAIFTDGLTECGTDRRHLLEIKGVIPLWEECLRHDPASLKAAEVAECLLGGALRYANGSLSDDLCLLTIIAKPAA
jgi:PAS domain S-box-containing protein